MTTIRVTLVVERVVEVDVEGLTIADPERYPAQAQAHLDANASFVREVARRTAIASGQAAPGDTIRLIRAVPAQKEIAP